MPKFKLSLSIGYSNAGQQTVISHDDLGYTEEEWANLTEYQQYEALQGYLDDWSSNYISTGYEEL